MNMSIITKNSVPVQRSIEDGIRKDGHAMDCCIHSKCSFSDCDKVNGEWEDGTLSQ